MFFKFEIVKKYLKPKKCKKNANAYSQTLPQTLFRVKRFTGTKVKKCTLKNPQKYKKKLIVN